MYSIKEIHYTEYPNKETTEYLVIKESNRFVVGCYNLDNAQAIINILKADEEEHNKVG